MDDGNIMHRQREIRQGGRRIRIRWTQSKNKAGAEQEQGGHRARIRHTGKKNKALLLTVCRLRMSFPFVLRLVACVAGVAAQDILAYVRHVEVGVYLCRTNLLVSEHRLDSPEVCPTLKERCGE